MRVESLFYGRFHKKKMLFIFTINRRVFCTWTSRPYCIYYTGGIISRASHRRVSDTRRPGRERAELGPNHIGRESCF